MNHLKKVIQGRFGSYKKACDHFNQTHGDNKIDPPMLSKIATGKYNPTVNHLKIICEETGTTAAEIYNYKDLDYSHMFPAKTPVDTRKGDRHKYSCRMSKRIPQDVATALPDMVRVCGYITVSDWLGSCLVRLEKEAKKKGWQAHV